MHRHEILTIQCENAAAHARILRELYRPEHPRPAGLQESPRLSAPAARFHGPAAPWRSRPGMLLGLPPALSQQPDTGGSARRFRSRRSPQPDRVPPGVERPRRPARPSSSCRRYGRPLAQDLTARAPANPRTRPPRRATPPSSSKRTRGAVAEFEWIHRSPIGTPATRSALAPCHGLGATARKPARASSSQSMSGATRRSPSEREHEARAQLPGVAAGLHQLRQPWHQCGCRRRQRIASSSLRLLPTTTGRADRIRPLRR